MDKNFASFRQLDHHTHSPIRVYRNIQPDDYPAHWHMSFEIIVPVREGYAVTVDGRAVDLDPGDLLIIPSGAVHEIFAPEEGMRYILMVDQDVIYATEGLAGFLHFFYPCVCLRGAAREAAPGAGEYLWRAIRESEKHQPLEDAAVVAWVRLALIQAGRELLRANAAGQSEHMLRMNERLLDIYAYITQHCSEKLTLEQVAAYSGYSKYHFTRIFKTFTGTSFHDFYLRQRMILCRQLLSELSLPVTEVASRAGFGSLATFNRVFKQYEGVTPSQFRQLRQKKRARPAAAD